MIGVWAAGLEAHGAMCHGPVQRNVCGLSVLNCQAGSPGALLE